MITFFWIAQLIPFFAAGWLIGRFLMKKLCPQGIRAHMGLGWGHHLMGSGRKIGAFQAGEIIGWRSWLIDQHGILHSMHTRHCWGPEGEMMGRPSTKSHAGVYAWKSKRKAMSYARESITSCRYESPNMVGIVIGSVELWGEVLVHDKGYRAEHARIKDIVHRINFYGDIDSKRIPLNLRRSPNPARVAPATSTEIRPNAQNTTVSAGTGGAGHVAPVQGTFITGWGRVVPLSNGPKVPCPVQRTIKAPLPVPLVSNGPIRKGKTSANGKA